MSRAVHDCVAGQKTGVIPNGFCWLIALLTAFGAMEAPMSLTEVDRAVINDVVEELQKFYRAERGRGTKWAVSLDEDGLSKKVEDLPALTRGGCDHGEFLARYVEGLVS